MEVGGERKGRKKKKKKKEKQISRGVFFCAATFEKEHTLLRGKIIIEGEGRLKLTQSRYCKTLHRASNHQ